MYYYELKKLNTKMEKEQIQIKKIQKRHMTLHDVIASIWVFPLYNKLKCKDIGYTHKFKEKNCDFFGS